jgi:hypothetical protein
MALTLADHTSLLARGSLSWRSFESGASYPIPDFTDLQFLGATYEFAAAEPEWFVEGSPR